MEQQFPSDPQDLNCTPYVYRPQREREDRFEELSPRGGGRDYTDPQLFVRGDEGVSVSDTLATAFSRDGVLHIWLVKAMNTKYEQWRWRCAARAGGPVHAVVRRRGW